jgi:hypothetical protein
MLECIALLWMSKTSKDKVRKNEIGEWMKLKKSENGSQRRGSGMA